MFLALKSFFLILIFCAVIAVFYFWLMKSSKRERRSADKNLLPPSNSPSDEMKDHVTQLYSRSHLNQRLTEYMARSERDKKSMAVVLWDLDRFVKFNNEFGQTEGDRLLRRVAETIKQSLRAYDEAFRSGPDEFCAILYPAESDITRDVTKRVSDIVSKKLFEGTGEFAQHKFSIAAGFVFYPGHFNSPEALIHAASQALYKEKLAHQTSGIS